MVFERPVSANEHLYLAMSGAFSHLVLQAVIGGKGRISAQQLQTALDKVSLNFPGTCLKLQRKRWVANASPPRVTILSEYPEFRSQLNLSLDSYDSFDPKLGRTCEVALAQRGNDCLLIFRALHAVMDGQGVLQWATAVFHALRGEDIPFARSDLTDDAFARLHKARIRHDEPSIPRHAGPRAHGQPATEAGAFDFARRTINGSVPGIVAQLATGVRKLLCSRPEDKCCVMVPVDARRAMPNGCDSTANLSFPLFIPVEAEDSWSDVSCRLLGQLNEKRYLAIGAKDWLYHRVPYFVVSWVGRKLWSHELRRGKYLLSAVISHIGKLELPEFHLPDFEAESIFCLPMKMPVAPLSLVVTEQASCTEICLVKPRRLWNDPGDVLDEVFKLAGLSIDKGGRSTPAIECIFGLPIKDDGPVPDISIRISEAARKYRDHIAVYEGNHELSYKDFVIKRDRVAMALLETIGKSCEGERIALLMNRSIEAFLCIHACLELNATFIPIDPQYPEERVRIMLEDSKPILLIHDETSMGVENVKSISVQTLIGKRVKSEGPLPGAGHDPSNLAYIIYTSGTTGRPKGVCITRGNLSHYINCAVKEFFLSHHHRAVPLVTSLSFDISILPLFAPLLEGCKVKIIRENAPPLALQQVLDDPDITFWNTTPPHLQIMMRLGNKPASLWQCLAVGGENLTSKLCREALAFFGPQLEVMNVYGPTETTVSVTHYRFDPEGDAAETIPVGKGPIDCAALYILKSDLSPCKEGEEGEIYIGGQTVSKGYWENEADTRKNFVPDPFRNRGLMYRSGDRAVYRNGGVYFVCRNDEQVKVNGYRVELEEIKTRLEQYSGIADAVVLLDQSGPKGILRGVFTTSPPAEVDSRDLKSFLGTFLPRFMIPTSFHQVDEIPVTINGKVDRRLLLSKIDATHSDSNEGRENRDVGDIWSSFLRVPRDQLSPHSNFFDLGGDSVLLLEILHEADRVFCGGTNAAALLNGLQDFFVNPELLEMMRLVDPYRHEWHQARPQARD